MSQKRHAEDSIAAPSKRQATQAGRDLDHLVRLPAGWRECPRYAVVPHLNLIASKVPLSATISKEIIGEQDRFTPEMLLQELQEQNITVGMVIDLTNSSRYYTFDETCGTSEFEYPGTDAQSVFYRKICCKGRGQAPQPDAVNEFCWTVCAFNLHCQEQELRPWTIVHCTHGFNRTGYMIANALMRLQGRTAASAAKFFADCRPPGIYKRHYIEELFKYNHELVPPGFAWPLLPVWKIDDDDDHPGAATVPEGVLKGARMQHDDEIGENVDQEEAEAVQIQVVKAIMGPAANELRFPGSQPVSLAASNVHLLSSHRYYVTWKADGTRYMLYIGILGTYLIDRSFKVRRVQMRWPTSDLKSPLKYDPAAPHNGTLMDGEMVVDQDKGTGQQTRRYLAYDIMQLRGKPLRLKDFKERWYLIDQAVAEPRNLERAAILKDLGRAAHHRRFRTHYMYQQEPFSMRRKEFWPVHAAEMLMDTFIPEKVCHEADGLILQPWVGDKSQYIPNTCEEVLKWKYAHLNSVDFRLRLAKAGGARQGAELLLMTRGGEVPVPGAKVQFLNKENAIEHNGEIIECSWDAKQEVWIYMRERRDKETPNAWHVYKKVLQSIEDNITPTHLVDIIKKATTDNTTYAKKLNPSNNQQAPDQNAVGK